MQACPQRCVCMTTSCAVIFDIAVFMSLRRRGTHLCAPFRLHLPRCGGVSPFTCSSFANSGRWRSWSATRERRCMMSMKTFLPAGFQFAWAFTAGRRCANQIHHWSHGLFRAYGHSSRSYQRERGRRADHAQRCRRSRNQRENIRDGSGHGVLRVPANSGY
jgi:hypothetical protein